MGNSQCCEASNEYPTEAVGEESNAPAVSTDEARNHEGMESTKEVHATTVDANTVDANTMDANTVDTNTVQILSIPTPAKIEQGVEASPKSATSGQEVVVSPKKKQHIQAYARDFVKEMVKGKQVQLLTHKAESLEPAKAASQCTLDPKLQFLNLSSKEGNVKATLAKIKNVYGAEEDGKAAFPAQVLELIAPEEHDKMLLIKYDLEDGKEASIMIVEDSLERQKRFAECMKYIAQSMQKSA